MEVDLCNRAKETYSYGMRHLSQNQRKFQLDLNNIHRDSRSPGRARPTREGLWAERLNHELYQLMP